MSNVVTDFHNFRNLYSSTDLFGLFGMCFSRYNFDRNIMYLDQSTLLICYYDIDRLGSIRKVDRDNRSSYYVICVVCHLSKPLNKETFQ